MKNNAARNYPGGAGSAGRQRAGESASAAYVRHVRLYLNNVRCHNCACILYPVSRTRFIRAQVFVLFAVCYGGESRRIAAPRCPPRRGIYCHIATNLLPGIHFCCGSVIAISSVVMRHMKLDDFGVRQ